MKRLLILDYGDVLYKPAPWYINALHETISRFLALLGVRATRESIDEALYEASESFQRDCRQPGIRFYAAMILSKHGLTPLPGRVERLAQVMKSVVVSSARLAEGAERLLSWAKGRGLTIAVLSNNWCGDCIRAVLERDGLTRYVDVVVSSDEIGCRKPCSCAYEAVERLTGMRLNEAIYIDDVDEYVEVGSRLGAYGIVHDGRKLDEYIPLLDKLLLEVD